MHTPKARSLLAGASLLAVGAGAGAALVRRRWRNKTAQMLACLTGSPGSQQGTVQFAALDTLPRPVAAYFRTVLRDGQPLIRSASIRQTGHFRTGSWQPFDATQYFAAHPPGFIWDARIGTGRWRNVQVRDSYAGGHGSMQAALAGVLSVVDAHDARELDIAALQRYLAEAVWLPTALLPRPGLRWQQTGEHSATAELTDGLATASLNFSFNDNHLPSAVFTPGRYREVNGSYELSPWQGQFDCYEERHGMCVPMNAEAAWQIHGKNVPYFKGRIVDIHWEFVQ